MDVDEPIEIVRPDDAWPHVFERERDRLGGPLAHLRPVIEHIGSTAIPGLAAKPIIDVLVAVDASDVDDAARIVAGLGYEDLGSAGVPGRRYLRRRDRESSNVHLFERSSALIGDNLVLRDYLRHHPAEVTAYANLKLRLVARGHTTLLRYSAAKGLFLAQLAERARAWGRAQAP